MIFLALMFEAGFEDAGVLGRFQAVLRSCPRLEMVEDVPLGTERYCPVSEETWSLNPVSEETWSLDPVSEQG